MSKKVKITLTFSEEDASILRHLAANDIRTLPKYCESVLIKAIRSSSKYSVMTPEMIERDKVLNF